MTLMKRYLPERLGVMLLLSVIAAARATTLWAADPPLTGAEPPGQTLPKSDQQSPLTPPPGISIIPTPPAGEAQPEGCPVRSLRPLELLV